MVSCKFVGIGNVAQARSILFDENKEFTYNVLHVRKRDYEGEEELPLKIYIERVELRKSYLVSRGYIDYPLELYRRDIGNFVQVVSAPFELQLAENEDPPLLIIYANKELQTKILGSIGDKIGVMKITFELAENFDKIKSNPAFQDVKQLRITDIQDDYLDKMVVTGRSVHRSPLVERIRIGLGGRPNTIVIIYRNVWVLVSRDARMFTPVPERHLPGGREEFFLSLYRELKKMEIVRFQKTLV